MAVECYKICNIIDEIAFENGKALFEDDVFQRVIGHIQLSETIGVEVIRDSNAREGIFLYYLSFSAEKKQEFKIILPPNSECFFSGMIHNDPASPNLLWMPVPPTIRHYDEKERIWDSCQITPEQTDSEFSFKLELSGRDNHYFEITILQFKKNIASFYSEITDRSIEEERTVIRYDWFRYSHVVDTWKYLIHGNIYSTENNFIKFSYVAQNLAYTLYFYLDYLKTQTNKDIYRILCDMVAHILLLSLPSDNCWKHSSWTDANESHCRHITSGIFVMLSYYQLTRNPVFLEKTESVCDALLVFQDSLSTKATWFLHDSLESNIQLSDIFYKPHRHTDFFGKSRSNTLCLNTHIWTQILLFRMYLVTKNKRYLSLFKQSMNPLKEVLQYRPLGFLYGAIYFIRDVLVNCWAKTDFNIFFELSVRYERLLRHSILPFLKKRYPRFIMPNGFSERDLDYTSLSDIYHLLNVKDMLMLYRQVKEPWLEAIIRKALRHLDRSSHIKWVDRKSKAATMILDIYLLAAGLLDDKYISKFVKWLGYFYKKGTPFTMDIFSNPLVRGSTNYKAENDHIFHFALPSFKYPRSLFVNLAPEEEVLEIPEIFSLRATKYIKVKNKKVAEVSADSEFKLGPYEWLIVEIEN